MSTVTKCRFKILVLDVNGDAVITNELQLLHATAANGELWSNCEIKNNPLRLCQDTCTLTATVIPPDDDLEQAFKRAFAVEIVGPYDCIESRRVALVKHYRHQRFDLIYILQDDVSEQIAFRLYPILYKVENALRGYLLRFMVTRLGPSWWDVTAKAELGSKVTSRKNNEMVFSDHIDNKAYLVDFGDLGKMVYSHSSGFTTKEDIVRRVSELAETPEAIKALKEQLQSNYQKFFRDTFKSKGFQEKWEQFEKLRHKIAHTSLFIADDLTRGTELGAELTKIVEEADSSAPTVDLPIAEKEAIRESFILRSNAWTVISEADFMKELAQEEARYTARGGYVGLAHFVKFHLGAKGYDFATSYKVADALKAKGTLELYDVTGQFDGAPVRAIRRANGA